MSDPNPLNLLAVVGTTRNGSTLLDILLGDTLHVYCGAADSVVCVAEASLEKLLSHLEEHPYPLDEEHPYPLDEEHPYPLDEEHPYPPAVGRPPIADVADVAGEGQITQPSAASALRPRMAPRCAPMERSHRGRVGLAVP
jgi:hypothetical protein